MFLEKIGFSNNLPDLSLFIWHHHEDIIIVLVYVDDFVIIDNEFKAIHDFIVVCVDNLIARIWEASHSRPGSIV